MLVIGTAQNLDVAEEQWRGAVELAEGVPELEEEIARIDKTNGKKVYTPDLNAFRTFAQKRYVDKYGAEWPKGAIERINAL